LHFKDIIEAITSVSGNKLQAYYLSEEQWQLADDVQEVLKAIKFLFYSSIYSNFVIAF
jgi:hypothetical protein